MIQVTKVGAKGNGVTDDTAAIQKALNQAAQSGDTVYFPSGIYLINPAKPLMVGGNTTIKGDGRSSVIKAGGIGFGWELMRVSGKNVSINSIFVDGNQRVNRGLVIGGGSSQVTVSNVSVTNATHSTDRKSEYYVGVVSGIVVYGNSSGITITDTEVANIAARNFMGTSLVARGIYVTTTWGSKERVAKKVTISNCYIHHITPADDGDGIYYEDPALENNQGEDVGSLIRGNRFDFCGKRAIKIFAEGITIQGNEINNPYLNNNYYFGAEKGTLAPDMYSAISIYGSNNTVDGNKIGGSGSFYAMIEAGSGLPVEDITIQNNNLVMGDKSNIIGTTAIRLGTIRDFRILSNTIKNGERAVWTWQNAESGLIKDNVIRMNKGGGIDLSTYLRGYVQKSISCLNNKITAKTFTVKTASTNENVTIR